MERLACLLIFFTLSLAGLAWSDPAVAELRPGREPPTEHRVALVIGNNAYPDAPLANAVNDARLMARTLVALGFQVHEGYDLDRTATSILVDRFLAALSEDGAGLVYFAGVAKEIGG